MRGERQSCAKAAVGLQPGQGQEQTGPDLKHPSFTFASCFSNAPSRAFFLLLALLAVERTLGLCWGHLSE